MCCRGSYEYGARSPHRHELLRRRPLLEPALRAAVLLALLLTWIVGALVAPAVSAGWLLPCAGSHVCRTYGCGGR